MFDDFKQIYVSFSGGKDSSVMVHLILNEAKIRNRKVGLLIIDLEAQYKDTIDHIETMVEMYIDNIDLHWFCGPLLLRNAVSAYTPRWICWDESKKDVWVRKKPKYESDISQYDFFSSTVIDAEFVIMRANAAGNQRA